MLKNMGTHLRVGKHNVIIARLKRVPEGQARDFTP